MTRADLPEFSDIIVRAVPVRDRETNEESTAWRATVDGDDDIPTFGGDTATEAVDVLLEHLRGDDHVSPFTDSDPDNEESDA